MTRTRLLQAACGTALMLPLCGCISVSPPDKPIEINLNVTIRQEVLVRLQRDVEQLIQQKHSPNLSSPSRSNHRGSSEQDDADVCGRGQLAGAGNGICPGPGCHRRRETCRTGR